MVIYLYRWKIKAGKDEDFKSAWSFVTKELREKCGSLGSRLHLGNDGIYYGYAQWPNREMRDQAKLKSGEMDQARAAMSEATQEMLPEVILEPLADFLI